MPRSSHRNMAPKCLQDPPKNSSSECQSCPLIRAQYPPHQRRQPVPSWNLRSEYDYIGAPRYHEIDVLIVAFTCCHLALELHKWLGSCSFHAPWVSTADLLTRCIGHRSIARASAAGVNTPHNRLSKCLRCKHLAQSAWMARQLKMSTLPAKGLSRR